MIKTTNYRRSAALALVACACAFGCSSDEPDVEVEHVKLWANASSAVGVYAHAYEPIAFADGEATFQDPSCPTTSDDGTTVTITGGCTSTKGEQYFGVATVERLGKDRKLTLDDYGHYSDVGSTGKGTVNVVPTGAGVQRFDVELTLTGGMTTTISYSGTVEGGYTGPTTWNGSGQVTRKGVLKPTGTVSATTEAQVLDNSVCSGQASSGTTTIKMDEGTAVITYDGATDCDEAKAAKWSFDGEDRGRIEGIVCAVGSVGGPHSGWAFLPFLAAGLVLLRRRI